MNSSTKNPPVPGPKNLPPGRPADSGLKKPSRTPVKPETREPVTSWAGFTIRLERQPAGHDQPPVVVALLAARIPGTDLLSHSRALEAALALVEARGFKVGGTQFKARPTVDVTRRFPNRPADWSSHRLEIWFTDFTPEALPWLPP